MLAVDDCAGGSSPGTAQDATTAGTSRPVENQCSAARSTLAATHWNGTARSSKRPGRWVTSSDSSGTAECSAVPVRQAVRARDSSEPPKTSPPDSPPHSRPSRATPAGVGSAANAAPLTAPTDVPTTRSGRTPASTRARSIPTSTAPSTPPPPSTNAVVMPS